MRFGADGLAGDDLIAIVLGLLGGRRYCLFWSRNSAAQYPDPRSRTIPRVMQQLPVLRRPLCPDRRGQPPK
jgi:hypothetical protein